MFINSNATGTTITITPSGVPVAFLSNLPAGDYLISAKVTLGVNAGSGQDSCNLSSGGKTIDVSYATSNPGVGIIYETASMLGTVSFATASAANSITVTCTATDVSALALFPSLTATKVGSVTRM
jgi:hypothetical protein